MDGVVAVSTAIGVELARRSPELAGRFTLIGYGVPLRATAPVKPPAPPMRVVYAGRLSRHQKRILDLAQIVAAIHESGVSVEFDIAGDGPDRQEFERIAAASIAAGSSRMHGALSPEATARLIDAAHVLVLTSEFEGLPVVLLEAMEAGCVPLVTRIRSGIGDLVEDGRNGVLFPIGDTAAAVDALRRLAAGRPQLEAMASAARSRLASSEFTIPDAADRYEALFARIFEERTAGRFAPPQDRPFIPRHHRWGPRIAARWARLTSRISK
jgi:glycosyltransferase involved in cell wall biosynthesis